MSEWLRARVEVDHFFEWLQEFEHRVQGLGGGGCWYSSAALKARVRYSWYQAAAPGRPAICFSDLQVADPLSGQAIVQAVATCFSYGHHALQAETLVVEHPSTTSMCEWLNASAFSPVLAPGEVTQSWYLSREVLLPRNGRATRDHCADLPGDLLGRHRRGRVLAAKKSNEGED